MASYVPSTKAERQTMLEVAGSLSARQSSTTMSRPQHGWRLLDPARGQK